MAFTPKRITMQRRRSYGANAIASAGLLAQLSCGDPIGPITNATAIAVNAGNAQTATAGTAVVVAPSVKVTDTNSSGVAGITVTFAVTSGGGSVVGGNATTGADGIATVTSWTLGAVAGVNTLTAAVPDLAGSPVTFSATAIASGSVETVRYCNANHAPIWFAYQSGSSGPWTSLTPNADGSYSVPVTTVGAIAWVLPAGAGFETNYLYLAKSEFPSIGCLADDTFGTKSLNGSVAGQAASEQAQIAIGSRFSSASGTATFSMAQVADGTRDLIAGGRAPLSSTDYFPVRFIIRRGLNPVSGATMPVIDFASAEALAPSSGTYTLSGVGGDSWFAETDMLTANLTTALLGFAGGTGNGANVNVAYRGPATAQQLGTDTYRFLAFASTSGSERGVNQNLTSFGNRSVTLGPPLSIPVVTTVVTSPNVRMRIQVASQTAYPAFLSAHFQQSPPNGRSVYAFVTAAYLGGTPTTWDLTMADLSTGGFQSVWGLQPGAAVSWTGQASSAIALSSANETANLYAARSSDAGPQPGIAWDAGRERRHPMMRPSPFWKR